MFTVLSHIVLLSDWSPDRLKYFTVKTLGYMNCRQYMCDKE